MQRARQQLDLARCKPSALVGMLANEGTQKQAKLQKVDVEELKLAEPGCEVIEEAMQAAGRWECQWRQHQQYQVQ